MVDGVGTPIGTDTKSRSNIRMFSASTGNEITSIELTTICLIIYTIIHMTSRFDGVKIMTTPNTDTSFYP